MGNKFASAKNSIAICDRCGFQYKLKQLRSLTIKTRSTNILVCSDCWEPDHPQLLLGMYPVSDPQGVRNPRADTSYLQGGLTTNGGPSGGSRVIQWGWKPVGLNNPLKLAGLTSTLQAVGQAGKVTVTIS